MTERGSHRMKMPRTLGGARRRMTAQLVLIGLGEALCATAFSILMHVLGEYARHPSRGVPTLAGVYRPFSHWSVTALLCGLGAAATITVVLKAVAPALAERLAQSYVHSVRMALFDHIFASEPWGGDRRTVGVMVLRFTGDSTALRDWASKGVATLLADGVFVLATVVALTLLAPLAGALVAGVLLLCAVAGLLLGRRLRQRIREMRRHNGRLASFVNERVTYSAVMQSLGRVSRDRRVLYRHSRRFSAAVIAQARATGALQALAEASRVGTGLAVIAASIVSGARPEVLASLLVVVGFLSSPLTSLVEVQQYWQLSRVARRRISEVLSAPARLQRPSEVQQLLPGPGRLDVTGLNVRGLLEDVTAVVLPGERVCVQGEAGAGKSLLLALLARLQVPDGGTVSLDGQDIARCDPDEVRRAVRLVSRELPLLRGSVEANLKQGEVSDRGRKSGKGKKADDPFQAALREWQDETLGRVLPDGVRTRVGEGGGGLSMAARYSVALARALRSRPRVLLLDEPEPDATLDNLLGIYPGTVVFAGRDPRLAERADVVWRIVDGMVTVHRKPAAAALVGTVVLPKVRVEPSDELAP